MKTFKSFLIFEFWRSLTWLNIVVLIVYFTASMYLVHRGIQEYLEIKETKEKFREIERSKVEKWNNYSQYGGYGFRLYFIPSALCIFFNNTNLFTEVTAHIDVGEKLNIYQSFKGKEIFMQRRGRFQDFSGFILFFGSLMALFYGNDAFRFREFLKSLARSYGRRRVFSYICLSRMILMCGYFIGVTICALLWVKIKGIKLTFTEFNYLLVFLAIMLVMLAFFFTIGTVTGSIKSKGPLIIFLWLAFVYLCPVGINTLIEERTGHLPSNYESELNKLTQLMNYENKVNMKGRFLGKAFEKIKQGEFKTVEAIKRFLKEQEERNNDTSELEILIDLEKILDKEYGNKEPDKTGISLVLNVLREKFMGKMMLDFERTEFPKIQEDEVKLTQQMSPNIRYQQVLSGIFPSTFYLAINNEISSRGYQNILAFHEYAKTIKDAFFKFYAPRKLAENLGKRPEMESFFEVRKDLSNVFEGESRIPPIYLMGLLFTVAWLLGALLLSYSLYKKALFFSPKEEVIGLEDLEVDLNKSEVQVVLTNKKITLSNHLYNALSGKNKRFKGKVLVKGINAAAGKKEVINFVYLCQPDQIPDDIRVKDFTSFMAGMFELTPLQMKEFKKNTNVEKLGQKTFSELEEKESGKVLLEAALLKPSDIYMFHDFTKGMPADFIKDFIERLQQLKQGGASILYITNDVQLARKIGDYVSVTKEDAALLTTSF